MSTLFPDAFGKEPVKKIFVDAIIENQFSQEKLFAAVKHVRDTFTGYGQPKIGDIINFDKKIKIFSRTDLMKKYAESYYPGAKYDPIASEYVMVNVNGEPRFVKKEDYREGLFEKWIPKPIPNPPHKTMLFLNIATDEPGDLSINELADKMGIDKTVSNNTYNPSEFSEEEKQARKARFNKILAGEKK